jgi:hypothetical protein
VADVPSGLSLTLPEETKLKETKVKLSLCLISYALCHEDAWGTGGIAPPFLTSALDGGDWSASRPCCFNPGESGPSVPIGEEAGWTLESGPAGRGTRPLQHVSVPTELSQAAHHPNTKL